MTSDPKSGEDTRRAGGLPFEAPRGVRLAAALASVVVSLALTGSVVLGMVGEDLGALIARQAGASGTMPA